MTKTNKHAAWIETMASRALYNGADAAFVGYLVYQLTRQLAARGCVPDSDEHRALARLGKRAEQPGACGLCAIIGTNVTDGPRAHAPGCAHRATEQTPADVASMRDVAGAKGGAK